MEQDETVQGAEINFFKWYWVNGFKEMHSKSNEIQGRAKLTKQKSVWGENALLICVWRKKENSTF